MAAREQAQALTAEFDSALQSLRDTPLSPDVTVTETPAPRKLAPYAAAFEADVAVRGRNDLAGGRLVLLHDPAGVEVWQGRYRFVAFVSVHVDEDMLDDPLLTGVGWSWLRESLSRHEATHVALSGTATRTVSESFGAISDRPRAGQLEIRASWTPDGPDLTCHLRAWSELLRVSAGLPPLSDGVVAMPPRRRL